MLRHALAVAGDDLDRDAGALQRFERRSSAGLGRIEEGGEACQHQLGLVVDHRVRMVGRDAAPGDREHAEALVLERVAARARGPGGDLVKFGRRRALGGLRGLVVPAQPEQVVGRALDDQPALVAALDQHRDAAALEVERHLVDLAPAADVDPAMFEDGFVERAAQAALEPAVEVGQLEHTRALLPERIDMALHADMRLGQRAGLVGAEDVHRAEVLDRALALDDDLLLRQAQRAARRARA